MSDDEKRFLGFAPIKREGGIYSDDPNIQKIIEENYRLRKENARLLEALKPFAARLDELEKMKASKYACATPVEIEHLRAARAAIQEGKA